MLRRDFLKAMAIGAAAAPLIVPRDLFAQVAKNGSAQVPAVLWLKRGQYEARLDYATEQGYRYVCWFLRDVQANVIGIPDWRLLQLLSWMQAWLAGYGHHVSFNIHSGLRTPITNNRTENAAQRSMHLPDRNGVFRAVDYSTKAITGDYLSRLADLARQGGVGFYTHQNFTHNDVGSVRHWRG